MLLGFGARAVDAIADNVFGGLATVYGVTVIGMPSTMVLLGSATAGAVEVCYIPLVGRLANRISRQRIYLVGVALIGILAYPFFVALTTGNIALVWVMMIAARSIASGTEFAVQSTLFTEMFPTRLRYTAISLIYQLTAVIGGLSNLAATALLIHTGGKPWLVAGLLVLTAAIGFACTAAMRRPSNSSAMPEPAAVS